MALVLFARRMLEYTGRGKFADVMEQALYNGALSGISLRGDQYFYANLLEVDANTLCPQYHLCKTAAVVRLLLLPDSYCRFLPQLGNFTFTVRQGEFRLDIPVGRALPVLRGRAGNRWSIPLRRNDSDYDPARRRVPPGVAHSGLVQRVPASAQRFSTEVKPAEGYVTLEREWLDGRPAGTLSGDAGRGRPRQLACHLRCRKDRLDAGGRSSMRWRVSTTATEFRG